MFEPVQFKSGDVRWLRTGDGNYLGRREIAEAQMDRAKARVEKHNTDKKNGKL